MKDLIIAEPSVHGREMAEIVERINEKRPSWNLLGYITNDEVLIGKQVDGYTVLGGLDALDRYPDAYVVPSNGWMRDVELPRERLGTIIDPSAFVSRSAKIGPGCVIYPNCFIGHNALIGERVFCLSGAVINHDNVIGEMTMLATKSTLAGCVRVGDDCYIGQSSTVRQFLTIGRNSFIGMGAVVVRDVEPDSIMVGNPAKKLRERPPGFRD